MVRGVGFEPAECAQLASLVSLIQSLVCERLLFLVLFIIIILGYYSGNKKYLNITMVVTRTEITMRLYILTEKEQEEIERFLKNKKSTNLIKVLKFRATRHIERLRQDLELLEKFVGG